MPRFPLILSAALLAAGCATSGPPAPQPKTIPAERPKVSASTGALREAGIDHVTPTLRRRPLLDLRDPPRVRRHLWDRESRRGDEGPTVRRHLWDRQ